jgi:hypothetical protein
MAADIGYLARVIACPFVSKVRHTNGPSQHISQQARWRSTHLRMPQVRA